MSGHAPDAVARLRDARAFLLDMDGTLYLGERALPGARALLATLRARGVAYVALTNNSSAAAADYLAKLARLGLDAGPLGVLTSGDATARWLRERTALRAPYVLGTPALAAAFRAAGLDPDAPEPDSVVVGYDRTLTYAKLARAHRLVAAGKPYFATHADRTFIAEDGLEPDVLALLAALRATAGRDPDLIIGKPEPPIVQMALAHVGADAARTVMVGDKLETDMAMARRHGLLGVLVRTGETGDARLAAWPEPPDLVVADAAELEALLRG